MINVVRLLDEIEDRANRHAGVILFAGLAGIAWHTGWRWRYQPRGSYGWPMSQPLERWPWLPKVSVLVAAWNEADQIEQHLGSFEMLGYPAKELILCAGGDDGTYARACRWSSPTVIVLEQRPGEGKQRALERCLALASGDVVVLTDADCLYADVAFLQLIEPLAFGTAQVVTGWSEPLADQTRSPLVQYQWFNDLAWAAEQPPIVDGILGRNCALLRRVLDEVGGFATPAATGTDYELSRRLARAGYAIRGVPTSRVATEYPDSPGRYLQMWRRWEKNLLVHGLRFGAWRDVRGVLAAFALGCTVFGGPIVAARRGPGASVVALLLFVAANANRLRRLRLGAQLAGARLSWSWLYRLPFYTALDLIAPILAVRDAVVPRLRTRW